MDAEKDNGKTEKEKEQLKECLFGSDKDEECTTCDSFNCFKCLETDEVTPFEIYDGKNGGKTGKYWYCGMCKFGYMNQQTIVRRANQTYGIDMTSVTIACERDDSNFDLQDYANKANTEAINKGIKGVEIDFNIQVCQGSCCGRIPGCFLCDSEDESSNTCLVCKDKHQINYSMTECNSIDDR